MKLLRRYRTARRLGSTVYHVILAYERNNWSTVCGGKSSILKITDVGPERNRWHDVQDGIVTSHALCLRCAEKLGLRETVGRNGRVPSTQAKLLAVANAARAYVTAPLGRPVAEARIALLTALDDLDGRPRGTTMREAIENRAKEKNDGD